MVPLWLRWHERARTATSAPTDSLPDDPGTLKAMLLAERTRAERLEQIIKEMRSAARTVALCQATCRASR
jgi:hypothetical protein